MKKLITIYFLIFTILISSAYSLEESFYINQVEDVAIINHNLDFNEPTDSRFYFNLPIDARGVSLKVDGEFLEVEGFEFIDLYDVSLIELEYITSEIISEDEILFDFKNLQRSNKLTVQVKLDENSKLKYKTGEGTITTSVYPQPYALLSNGQNIIVEWERKNVEEGSGFSGFILLKKDISFINNNKVLILTSLLILLILILIFNMKHKEEIRKELEKNKKRKAKPKKKKTVKKASVRKTTQKKNLDILKHLKSDEKQVVRILKTHEGICEQGTIRTVGDFSKATLSRILSELEERNIISKEKKGKKNIVHLK